VALPIFDYVRPMLCCVFFFSAYLVYFYKRVRGVRIRILGSVRGGAKKFQARYRSPLNTPPLHCRFNFYPVLVLRELTSLYSNGNSDVARCLEWGYTKNRTYRTHEFGSGESGGPPFSQIKN